MPRDIYMDDDSLDRADETYGQQMLSDALAGVRFRQALPNALSNIQQIADSWKPLPIVVSPRPESMQQPLAMPSVMDRPPATPQTPTVPGSQTEQPVASPEAATSSAPSQGSVRSPGASGVPSAMPSASSATAPRGDPSGGVEQWSSIVDEASKAYGVPPDKIKGIMHIESGGRTHDAQGNPLRSSAGAIGLMQTMPFHYQAGENPDDPRTNIMRGTKILADNYARYHDWDKAAAAYFGAIDGNGNITGASDGNTDGYGYVRQFNEAAARYQGGAQKSDITSPAGPSAGVGSGSLSVSPAQTASSSSSPSAAGASGTVTLRHKVTGAISTLPASLLPGMTNRNEFDIVPDQTMQKVGDTQTSDEPGLSPGDQKRPKLAAASGQPQPMPDGSAPYDWQLPAGQQPPLDNQRHIVPFDPSTQQDADPGTMGIRYRQPLGGPNMGPDTATTADEPTSTYNDPTADGTISQPLPAQANQQLDARTNQGISTADDGIVTPGQSESGRPAQNPADDPGGAQFAAQDAYSTPGSPYSPYGDQPDATHRASPDTAPTSPTSTQVPVWDDQGEVVGYRQAPPPRQSAPTVQATPEGGEPDYVPPRQSLVDLIQPMGGAPDITARMRQIQANAAIAQGIGADPIRAMNAPNDPTWRAQNPEMAQEYDDLSSQLGMVAAGQTGDVPHLGRGAGAADAAAAPNIGSRIRGALDANAERVAAADARMAEQGSTQLGMATGPVPAPESRIPGAGYASDLRPGAETAIRQDVARNAVDEPMRRAEVARKAQDVLGIDPETVRGWQDDALARDEAAPVVRGEALRQARVIDAENADRAIERLRAAQERARTAGGLSDDGKFDVADALLEAAEAARGMQRSGAADTAEARAAARQLGQRRNAILARQAYESALRARQVGQDAAFAAKDAQVAARTGRVTPQGEARLRALRDKLLEAERHGLVGDGASGRLDDLEPVASTAAAAPERPRLRSQGPDAQPAARVGPTRAAARSEIGLGTQVATDIGNSVLGAGAGGAAGYTMPAGSEEERRKNAQTGAVVGAIGSPIIGRTLRGRGGALGLLGPVPTPENRARALAIGADPAKRYEFRYRVVDLDSLTPSNLPNGAPNPAFPRELQPRSRERAASQLQIGQIAQSLDPVALLHDAGRLDSGPPIIGSDSLVESGNGRTLALQRAAEQHPERYQAYVDTLRSNLGEFGLSEHDLQGVQRPVLVRERVTPVDRTAFVQEANGATVLGMSPAEKAAQSAANMSDDIVTNLHVGESDTIASALRRTENRDLVRSWVGSLPENERSLIMDAKGDISPQGYDQLANALLTRTYGEGATTRAFIESGDPAVKNVQNAVMGSLPDMARAEALIRAGQRDPGLSVAEDVAKATEVLARLKQEGMSVGDYVKQIAMGDRELTPFQETVLQFLDQNQRRPAGIRSALREYANVVENAADPNQVDMFGGQVASVSKEDAWTSATAGVTRERQARAATRQAQIAAENAARTPASDIVPRTGGPEGSLAIEGAPATPTAPQRPGAVGSLPTGGPEGSLAVQGAPQPTPRPGPVGEMPRGGPEGSLSVEGAPVQPANLPPVGDMSTGGPEGTLSRSLTDQQRADDQLLRDAEQRNNTANDRLMREAEGRNETAARQEARKAEQARLRGVADQIDQVLANPGAPGSVERLQQLHADLTAISQHGFERSSDIRRRLQRNGLLKAGLASKDQNVDGLVQALANVDPDKPEQMQAVLQILSKPRLIDRIMEYQYVNMLSSLITQGVNVVANAMQMAGRLVLQNPLEYAYSGGQSTGVGAAFKGAARGFRESMPEVRQIMRTGTSTDAVERATETGNYSQVGRELLTEQFGKAGAALHFISTRPLQAMDALFGHMAYASAAEQYAQRTADRLLKNGAAPFKGLSRDAARAKVMANIWDYPEVIEKAGKIQDYTLLKSNDASNNGFGIAERELRRLASLGHAPNDADFARQVLAFGVNNVLPFFNVPLNSAKQGLERTVGVPVNLGRGIRASMRGETEKAAELYSKATIGAAAVMTAGALAASGDLTGEGPGGSEQKIWELDHRRNSFRVPGTSAWFSWEGTPLAIPFGMVAGVKQGWSEASERADKKGQTDNLDRYGMAALKGGQGAVQGFASQSFIRAMGDQYKLITGDETGLSSVANQATSNVSRFVPASGMWNFLAKVSDTMERDPGKPQSFSDLPQNIGAREAMRLPGLRQQVDSRLTPYGEPMRNEQYGPAGALPYYRGSGVGAGDPINQAVEKAGVGAPTAPTEVYNPRAPKQGPIPLTMRDQRVFQQAYGRAYRSRLEGNDAGRGDLTADQLDKIKGMAREDAVRAILTDLGPDEIERRLGLRQPAGVR